MLCLSHAGRFHVVTFTEVASAVGVGCAILPFKVGRVCLQCAGIAQTAVCFAVQITCQGLYDPLGDVPVTVDTLGTSAPAVKNLSFASFWLQLPLTIVSAGILFFAVQFTRTVSK